MNRQIVGWSFVAIQGLLLVALIVLPGRDDWATPPWLTGIGFGFIALGLGAIGLASLRLGPALTATPVPTARATLVTNGAYRYVRHPIYTAVLTIVLGLTIRSGSVITLGVAVATVGFFTVKARWEEARLAERYPEYRAYAAVTPRFVPWPAHTSDKMDPT